MVGIRWVSHDVIRIYTAIMHKVNILLTGILLILLMSV